MEELQIGFGFLFCFLLFPFNKASITDNMDVCGLEADSFVTKGIALEGHSFWSSKSKDALECAKQCIKMRRCKSFNFASDSRRCELNDATVTDDKRTRTGLSLLYSDISVWPGQIDPDCFDRPCGDDEVCVPGHITGGTSCSYSCFKLPVRCPVPEGTKSNQSRTVGSVYRHTCDRGYKGGDTALCLPSGAWNKTINTSCTPIFGSTCTTAADCESINSTCLNGICQCAARYNYDAVTVSCVRVCEANWIQFENSCYFFEMDELSYPDARTFCNDSTSHLVQVDTADEMTFLRNQMNETSPPPVLGYWNDLFQVTDNLAEVWRTSGDPYNPSVSGWDDGEPNDYAGFESCTAFLKSEEYMWNDITCENDVRNDKPPGHVYETCRPVCEKHLNA